MTTAWPQIPTWQQTLLETLGQEGELYGVTPRALGVIDKEESGGSGGGINPEGYGGFFGEGETKSYPGGTATGSLLQQTTPTAFAEQAHISASAFASYLQEAGGSYTGAEEIYQSGSTGSPTPGSELFDTYGFGNVVATTSKLGSSPALTGLQLPSWARTGLNWLFPNNTTGYAVTSALTKGSSAVGNAVSSSLSGVEHSFVTFLAESIFVVAGVTLIVLGAWRLAKPKGEGGTNKDALATVGEAVAEGVAA